MNGFSSLNPCWGKMAPKCSKADLGLLVVRFSSEKMGKEIEYP
jgi:hypothetical protein